MITNLPVPVTPVTTTARLIPMPVFFANVPLSFLGVMLFPDDLILARKFVARLLLYRGGVQDALAEGIQIDHKYMTAILNDMIDGQPDIKHITRRMYWASAVGQVFIGLLAMIDSPNPQVQERASMMEAVEQAERALAERDPRGRHRHCRGASSTLHPQLRKFCRVLHMCTAWELVRAGYRPPKTIDGMMLSAMAVYERLHAWHVTRRHRGDSYLDAAVFWRWPGMAYDDSHGVPLLMLDFDRLTTHGRPGRPRK